MRPLVSVIFTEINTENFQRALMENEQLVKPLSTERTKSLNLNQVEVKIKDTTMFVALFSHSDLDHAS